MTTLPAATVGLGAASLAGTAQASGADLSRRLDALSELVRIGKVREGQDGFAAALIGDSEALLRRAGERLRLSANHTVVALAGGTGSGKSTLFNALAGAPFSPPGVTRPTTRHVHACVWGMQGAGPLLDWLGVQRRHRYARASMLDSGEAALGGLLLLDLPDHDSVVTASAAAVDRLSKLADMLVFVLDPQKYADASVHRRYLVPLAGHSSVITIVLNQIDTLPPGQVRECVDDLRRLLDSEGLADTQLLSASARTGAGLDDLCAVLASAVAAGHASTERISADVDALAGGYALHAAGPVAPPRAVASASAVPPATGNAVADEGTGAGEDGTAAGNRGGTPPWESGEDLASVTIAPKPPWEDAEPGESGARGPDPADSVPDEPAEELIAAFARAAGISAMAETLASAREAQASRFTGWLVAGLARGRRDPVRDLLAGAGTGTLPAPRGAQQSEVDNAITRFTDALGRLLPAPWSRCVRDAARSAASGVPAALAAAVRETTTESGGLSTVPAWWRLIRAWQWLLGVLAVAGVAWAVVIAVAHGVKASSPLLSDTSLIPWLLVMAAAMLLLGWLTASGSQNMALMAAERERDRAESRMRSGVAAVARDLVLTPAGREISEYERFRRELAVMQGSPLGLRP